MLLWDLCVSCTVQSADCDATAFPHQMCIVLWQVHCVPIDFGLGCDPYTCSVMPSCSTTRLPSGDNANVIICCVVMWGLQDYLNLVVSHPALQGSAELRLFLTAAGDLSTCTPWQRMVQRPAPMDALLGIRKADASSDSAAGDPAATGSSSSTAAGSASAGGGWGMMARMRHSIMNVVQQKQQQPELSAEEQQLRQAKDWLK
jgi:hypothetical protein